MDNYQKVNEVYLKFFTKNPPARSCFGQTATNNTAQSESEGRSGSNESRLCWALSCGRLLTPHGRLLLVSLC